MLGDYYSVKISRRGYNLQRKNVFALVCDYLSRKWHERIHLNFTAMRHSVLCPLRIQSLGTLTVIASNVWKLHGGYNILKGGPKSPPVKRGHLKSQGGRNIQFAQFQAGILSGDRQSKMEIVEVFDE